MRSMACYKIKVADREGRDEHLLPDQLLDYLIMYHRSAFHSGGAHHGNSSLSGAGPAGLGP